MSSGDDTGTDRPWAGGRPWHPKRGTDREITGHRPVAGGSTTPAEGTAVAVDTTLDKQARATLTVFLLSPIVWMGHFLLVYIVAEAGCTGSGTGLDVFNPPVPVAFTLIATAVAAAVCLACAMWGYRRWQAGKGVLSPYQQDDADELSAGGSLEFAGFVLSLIFFMSVLMVGLPALWLSPC